MVCRYKTKQKLCNDHSKLFNEVKQTPALLMMRKHAESSKKENLHDMSPLKLSLQICGRFCGANPHFHSRCRRFLVGSRSHSTLFSNVYGITSQLTVRLQAKLQ